MLSRSAERLYWLARYLERTENTARLVSVYMNLMLDLPIGLDISWDNLLNICGMEAAFFQRYKNATEQNTMRFLLAETTNPGSLFSSISFARENMRTTRDLMPDEAWHHVNEMYLFAKGNLDSISQRRGRVLLLQEIMNGCQRFTGFLSGAMSHNDALRFIRIGRNVERTDMTTRILDIASVLLAGNDDGEKMREIEIALWIHVLKSLSALLMYRKHCRHRIEGNAVLEYLLQDKNFPRSVWHCLDEVEKAVTPLPNSAALYENLTQMQNLVTDIDIKATTPNQLHIFLDDIQASIGNAHFQIAATWFTIEDMHQQQQQA
jgi:uncharacterized alpha-E superfamily protein